MLGAAACARPAPPPSDPGASVAALVARAEQETDDAEAADLLRRALELEPDTPALHARLFARTGMAPRQPPASGVADRAEAEARVRAHPYDPWARVVAAQAAPREVAVGHLRWALVLADLDPNAAGVALRELRRLDPSLQGRRLVPVHVLADETVRADPGWRFRLRFALKALSETLDPALETLFFPLTFRGFDGSQAGRELSEIAAASRAAFDPPPARGILLAVTERPPPVRRGPVKLGEAEFLGRRLTARLRPGEVRSRVLTHEVLHLYGAVHLADRVDSLMNPDGGDWILREPNAAIVRQTRVRRFGPGGIEENVLPFIDVEATADAYLSIVRANLTLRRAGVQQILRETTSARARAQRLERVARLDPHLGDVCDFTARLLYRAGRPEESQGLFELAARLYGLGTPRARASLLRATAVRSELSDP